MKCTLLYYCILSFILFSCQQKNKNSNTSSHIHPAEMESSRNIYKDNQNPLMNFSFIKIEESEIYLFPLAKNSNDKRGGFKSYKGNADAYSWNILFYNANDNTTYSLTESKLLITDLFYHKKNMDSLNLNLLKNYNLYVGIEDDFNQDNELNRDDPLYLYLSDKTGKNFKQISPKNESLKDWSYIPEKNSILIISIIDEDNDKIFETNQPINITTYNLDTESTDTNILTSEFKKQILYQYNKHWTQ